MNDPTFITGNEGKATYLKEHLGISLQHHKLDLPEIQSMDLEEVVRDKVRRAFAVLGTPVLVEDVSLVFDALNGLPGPFIKWFLEALGNDGLCKLLEGRDRRAVATVMFGYCNGDGVRLFTGSVHGDIPEYPRGENGFGWDAIFVPIGYKKTFAEMTNIEKHEVSMRKKPVEELKQFLREEKA